MVEGFVHQQSAIISPSSIAREHLLWIHSGTCSYKVFKRIIVSMDSCMDYVHIYISNLEKMQHTYFFITYHRSHITSTYKSCIYIYTHIHIYLNSDTWHSDGIWFRIRIPDPKSQSSDPTIRWKPHSSRNKRNSHWITRSLELRLHRICVFDG